MTNLWHEDCYHCCVALPDNVLGIEVMNLSRTMENVLLRRSYSTDMAELSLLLPGWQMQELAEAAAARGMTVGQLMRGYIQQMLSTAFQPFPKNVEN